MDLVPIRMRDFEGWADGVRHRLAAPRVGTRDWPASSALIRAGELMAKLLPEGLTTLGHHIYAATLDAATVGHLWMRIDGPEAFIFDIDADGVPMAVLLGAASDAAVALGASVLRMNVFATDAALLSTIDDFEVSNSQMRLWLDRRDPPRRDTSMDLSLRDMSSDEFALFLKTQEVGYADGLFRSRLEPSLEEARLRAIAENDESLPDGVDSAGQILRTAWAGGDAVGTIWLEPFDGATGPYAFVSDLLVHPQYRRRGYGRAIMLAAERECRERGIVVLCLSVFGFNTGARSLYEQIGYEITEQMVWRDLS